MQGKRTIKEGPRLPVAASIACLCRVYQATFFCAVAPIDFARCPVVGSSGAVTPMSVLRTAWSGLRSNAVSFVTCLSTYLVL